MAVALTGRVEAIQNTPVSRIRIRRGRRVPPAALERVPGVHGVGALRELLRAVQRNVGATRVSCWLQPARAPGARGRGSRVWTG